MSFTSSPSSTHRLSAEAVLQNNFFSGRFESFTFLFGNFLLQCSHCFNSSNFLVLLLGQTYITQFTWPKNENLTGRDILCSLETSTGIFSGLLIQRVVKRLIGVFFFRVLHRPNPPFLIQLRTLYNNYIGVYINLLNLNIDPDFKNRKSRSEVCIGILDPVPKWVD